MPSVARKSQPMPTDHPHVVRTDGVCGGRPHLRGSRIAVSAIAEIFRRGEPAAEIVATFPHLDSAAVYDAISYYLDHRTQIDAEIEAGSLPASLENAAGVLGQDGVVRFRSER